MYTLFDTENGNKYYYYKLTYTHRMILSDKLYQLFAYVFVSLNVSLHFTIVHTTTKINKSIAKWVTKIEHRVLNELVSTKFLRFVV